MSDDIRDAEPEYYRLVIIHDDGTKEVRLRNLSQEFAEAVKVSINGSGSVIVERQERRRAKKVNDTAPSIAITEVAETAKAREAESG